MIRLTAVAAMLLLGAPALAAIEGLQDDSGRRLGGHDFLLSQSILSPFAYTEFASTTGGGLLSVSAAGSTTSYSVAVIAQELRFQLALGDFVAVRVGASGSGAVGANSDSALNVGEFVGYQFSGGAVAGVTLGILRVGVSVDAQLGTTYNMNPAQAIADSLAAGTITVKTLLHQSSTTQLSPGLQLAVGLHPAVGLLVHGRYNHESSDTEGVSASSDTIDAGAGLSVDLRPAAGAPLGLLGAYNLNLGVGSTTNTTHTLEVGLFYTGRRDLSLGIDGSVQLESIDPISRNIYAASIVIHYFW